MAQLHNPNYAKKIQKNGCSKCRFGWTNIIKCYKMKINSNLMWNSLLSYYIELKLIRIISMPTFGLILLGSLATARIYNI